MNKYENFSKDQLIKHIEEIEKKLRSNKYGLYWDSKIEEEENDKLIIDSIPIFEPKDTIRIKNSSNDNLLLEGDNFSSLSTLRILSNGVPFVDMIYIDPPYNTGNKDFIYNDSFVEIEDGFRHSKWLSFMEKRLIIARDLLKDDGVIFISIDDNEQANLKLLCDSVFGEKNYLSTFIWINNLKGRQISKGGAVKTYESILLYSKNSELIDTFSGNILKLKKDMPMIYKNKNYEILSDSIGEYVIKNELYNTNSNFNEITRPNLVYNIYYNGNTNEIKCYEMGKVVELNGFTKIEPHKNGNGTNTYHAWRWSREKVLRESYNLHFVKFDDTYKIFTKIRDIYTTSIKDILSDSTNGNSELRNILINNKFSYPKPVKLIKSLISFYKKTRFDEEAGENISVNEPLTILDFFAGSGTTGQAVLELNQEDGGNRKFILCTNNENNICTDVTYPRLKTVITGVRRDGSKYSEGIPANLHYYKTDFIPHNGNVDQSKYDLVEKVNHLLCIRENVYDLIDQSGKFYIYASSNGTKEVFMYIDYYDRPSFDKFLNKIQTSKAHEKIVYVFSTDNTVDERLFEGIKGTELKPIPSKMYEIYKHIVEEIKRGIRI